MIEAILVKGFGVVATAIIASYAFIIKRYNDRLIKLEEKPNCNESVCHRRFENIEEEQKEIKLVQKENNPMWIEIKERLASIEATLKYLSREEKKTD